jgi:hypothetical protein
MALVRKDGLTQLYREMVPEADSQQIVALVMVTQLVLDNKLSLGDMTEKVARNAIKEKMDEVRLGSGTLSSFVYGVSKRVYSAIKRPKELKQQKFEFHSVNAGPREPSPSRPRVPEGLPVANNSGPEPRTLTSGAQACGSRAGPARL